MTTPASQSGSSPIATNPNEGGGNGNDVNTHNPAQNKADLDVVYLKEKKIPALLETLAAEFIVHKPHDPEAFLKNRFFIGSEGGLDNTGEAGIVTISTLCPLSAIAKMALSRCTSAKMQLKTLDPSKASALSTANAAGAGKSAGGATSSGFPSLTSPSPFGKTPCIEHNGLVVLEAGPVARYLCHGTPYLPSALRQRVKVEVAFDVIVANVLPHAITTVNEKYVLPRLTNRPVDTAAIQQAASKFRSDLVQLLGRVGSGSVGTTSHASSSAFFSESTWVAGREPSIADMALAAGLFAVQSVGGYDCITGLTIVERWWEAVQSEQWFTKGLGDWQSLAVSLHTR